MKKIILIFYLLISLVSFSQINLEWRANNPNLGKVYATQLTESKWKLCADTTAPGIFDYWTIRYYDINYVINDTIYDVCIEFDTTGMNYYEIVFIAWYHSRLNIEEIKYIILHPNPTFSIIYFSNIIDEYKLIDLRGRILQIGTFIDYIDISDYESGIYFLILDNKIYKVIKQ